MSDDLFGDIEKFINGSKDPLPPLFTEDEYSRIIMAFAQLRDESNEGFYEEEADALLTWCNSIRLSNTLLDLVLKGLALIGWEGTEPTFKISPLGREVVNNDGA